MLLTCHASQLSLVAPQPSSAPAALVNLFYIKTKFGLSAVIVDSVLEDLKSKTPEKVFQDVSQIQGSSLEESQECGYNDYLKLVAQTRAQSSTASTTSVPAPAAASTPSVAYFYDFSDLERELTTIQAGKTTSNV
jgi:hypothetical protein